MTYVPYTQDQLNIIGSHYTPQPVKAFDNKYYRYWCRSLVQRMQSALILDTPWKANELNFLYWCLFKRGYVAVLYLPEYGLIFQPCFIGGYNLYYQPSYVTISNPKFKEIDKTRFELGSEALLLQLTPDYLGTWDIVSVFAEKLAGLDSGINMSIINSRLAWILGAKTKAAAEAIKRIFDKINRGEPTAVFDKRICDDPQSKDSPFQFLERPNLKNNYITSEQIQDQQSILNLFDAEIGIVTIPYNKKERMVTSEAESRQDDALARITVWNDCLNQCFDIINEKYNTNMRSSIRHDMIPSGGADYGE